MPECAINKRFRVVVNHKCTAFGWFVASPTFNVRSVDCRTCSLSHDDAVE